MGAALSLLLWACLANAISPDPHYFDGRPALPDTATFRAEVAAFGDLSVATRARQTDAAADVLADWLPDFRVKDGQVTMSLTRALGRQCYQRVRTKGKLMVTVDVDVLSEAIAACQDAVVVDPTNLPLRVVLGLILVKTGLPREGVNELEKALLAAEIVPVSGMKLKPDDEQVRRDYLRHTALINLAYGYRALGRWDEAAQAADNALALRPTREAKMLKGLCLAGAEETSAAMSWAVKMPPLDFRRITWRGWTLEPHPSAYANEWIKSQALFAIGDLDGAGHVLGDLKRRFFQRMPHRSGFWQDAALIAELKEDPQAAWLCAYAGANAYLRFFYPAEEATFEPIILGFPAWGNSCVIAPNGGFVGGSAFGYIVEQLNIMAVRSGEYAAEQARIRALDLCDGLLARGVRSDLVQAFRARVYWAADQESFAYQDLVSAQAGFAARQVVDPGTSLRLGLQELQAGNTERSAKLFREVLAETPDNALAWRELGIALGKNQQPELARQAMDKALELEPDSMEGWYNLGILAHQEGRHDEALHCFEKAWSLQPGEERIQKMLQTVATARRLTARSAND